MTKEEKKALLEQLFKRIQSFVWRAGMMLLAIVVQFTLDNMTQFHLSPQITVVVGLVLGEVSKYLNTASK